MPTVLRPHQPEGTDIPPPQPASTMTAIHQTLSGRQQGRDRHFTNQTRERGIGDEVLDET